MSQKQAYTNKNKNPFEEYEEQLKNGTAQHMTHYTDEELKKFFEQEEQAQNDPSYSPNHLLSMIKAGLIKNITPEQCAKIIPPELEKRWLKSIEEKGKFAGSINKYRKANPHASWDEVMREVSKTTTPVELQSEMKLIKDVFELLWNKGGLLNQEKINAQLFKNVDNQDNFGISNILADTMYHLIDLLGIELQRTYGDHWEAKGIIKDSYGREIRLEYPFQALTKEEAEKRLDEYKHMMKTKGIKTWMAYWKVANERGRPEYTCPFIEVMKCMSDENREAHFSTKEKQECWEITKILKQTTIKMYRPIRKNRTRWVEQPMVDILGGENENSTADKYPLTVSVRVLSAQVAKDEFAPIIYKNKTLLLNPGEALLAYALQTRAARKKDGNSFDWDYSFALGNVQNSAKANPRDAKAKIRKKLTHLKDAGIIDSFTDDKNGIRVMPSKKIKEKT